MRLVKDLELTKNVVRVAKVFGVDVEAELGHVGNGDSIDSNARQPSLTSFET